MTTSPGARWGRSGAKSLRGVIFGLSIGLQGAEQASVSTAGLLGDEVLGKEHVDRLADEVALALHVLLDLIATREILLAVCGDVEADLLLRFVGRKGRSLSVGSAGRICHVTRPVSGSLVSSSSAALGRGR